MKFWPPIGVLYQLMIRLITVAEDRDLSDTFGRPPIKGKDDSFGIFPTPIGRHWSGFGPAAGGLGIRVPANQFSFPISLPH